MQFIPISDNNLINLDRIDLIRVDTVKGSSGKKKVMVLVIGGASHRVDDKYVGELLPLLLTKGNNISKQYFSL